MATLLQSLSTDWAKQGMLVAQKSGNGYAVIIRGTEWLLCKQLSFAYAFLACVYIYASFDRGQRLEQSCSMFTMKVFLPGRTCRRQFSCK